MGEVLEEVLLEAPENVGPGGSREDIPGPYA